MYQVVASDLDGTLLSPVHTITTYTSETLSKLTAKDIHFIFATGRHHVDVAQIRKNLAIDAYMITSNGARVHDLKGKLLTEHNIIPEIAQELFSLYYANKQILTQVFRHDEWFIARDHAKQSEYYVESGFNPRFYHPDTLPTDGVGKIFFTCERQEPLHQLEHSLKQRFGQDVHISFSLPVCLEVMAAGVSKGQALEQLLLQLGYSLDQCIAFGDGMNDKEMLSMVGKGCIMQNAHDRLIDALPQCEVIGSNQHDAVARYLRDLYQA